MDAISQKTFWSAIFLNENIWIAIKISLEFVPKGPINNIPVLVWIMAWRRSGGKPLSEQMVVSLLMHICVTRPQWVNLHILHYTYIIPCQQRNLEEQWDRQLISNYSKREIITHFLRWTANMLYYLLVLYLLEHVVFVCYIYCLAYVMGLSHLCCMVLWWKNNCTYNTLWYS